RRLEDPGERDQIPRSREGKPPWPGGVGHPPDHPDHRCGENRPGGRLIVEGHVAADDWDPERVARQRDPLDGANELPRDVRLLWVAEVQAVRESKRPSSDTGEVRGALEHRLGATKPSIASDPSPVPLDR